MKSIKSTIPTFKSTNTIKYMSRKPTRLSVPKVYKNKRKKTIIRKYGGKYRQIDAINSYIKKLASVNDCHTFIELTGGGGRTVINLPTYNINNQLYQFYNKIYNEIDRGLCNLFTCVQDKQKLEELIKLLLEFGRNREKYVYAANNKSNKDLDEITSAAYTFMVASLSWSGTAGKNDYMSGRTQDEEIYYTKRYLKDIDSLREKSSYLEGIQIVNGDYKDLLNKFKQDKQVIKYIDPPYHPVTRSQEALKVYDLEWTLDEHEEMVNILLQTESWILSGYDPLILSSKTYLPLEEAGAEKINIGRFTGSTHSKKKNMEEYLWIKY